MTKTSKKVGAAVIATCMAASIYLSPNLFINNNTGATTSDKYMTEYLSELQEAKRITFQNMELYELLKTKLGENFTISDLHNITSLTIDTPLSNTDFSDLKNLVNLESLNIDHNNINCSDLKYNQNLTILLASNCSMTNTEDLPNTISTLDLLSVSVTDEVLVVPYSTSKLYLSSTGVNLIQFKNPTKLKAFDFYGYGIIDLNDLKDCSSLKELRIRSCPNIINSELLETMDNTNITLDEFCVASLDKETISSISSLDEYSKKTYLNLINKLDEIANNITSPDMTEEEKINNIILYVVKQIEYDHAALEETKEGQRLLNDYNDYPISLAFNENSGVCVGYATLFTSLAKRVGIDCYQPDSINHTWNMIKEIGESKYSAYDLTALDHESATIVENGEVLVDTSKSPADYIEAGEEEKLFYYDFDLNQVNSATYETIYNPANVSYKNIDIGYLKPQEVTNNGITKNDIRLCTAELEILALTFYVLVQSFAKDIEKKKKETQESPRNKKTVSSQEKQIIKYKRVN